MGQTTRSPVVGMWGLVVGRFRWVVVGRKARGSWVGVWLRHGRVVDVGRDMRYTVEVEFCGWNGGGLGWRLAYQERIRKDCSV